MGHPIIDDAEILASSLLYRNYFILGPIVPAGYDTWKKFPIGDSLVVAGHPILTVTQVTFNNVSLTCLGYLLDPHHPEATDQDILEHLLGGNSSFESVRERSDLLGGRWIIIYHNGTNTFLFNDAGGLRQVFHTIGQEPGGIWCASQPMMIANALHLEIDKQAAAFMEALHQEQLSNPTFKGQWWPGAGSQYKEVRHLLPNHYLDLNSGSVHRFFPDKPLDVYPVEQLAERVEPLLQGMMLSAINRFDDLTLLITSGLDSRMVLAASRPFADKLSYTSIDYPRGNKQDVLFPSAMLSQLQLPHEVTQAQSRPSKEFGEFFAKHAMIYNYFNAANAEALLPILKGERVAITGNNTGIFTKLYRIPPLTMALSGKITPEMLALLTPEMLNHPYAIEEYDQWLKDLGDIEDVNLLLDIFYLEQRTGSWNADWLAGYDLIWKDVVVPINSRELVKLLIVLKDKDSKGPYKAFNRTLISKMWPELPAYRYDDFDPPRTRVKKELNKSWNSIKKNLAFTFR